MNDELTPIQAKTVHDTVQHMNNVNRDLKLDDNVRVRIEHMDSIPAGANPFHYELYLRGTIISRGWMVMHEGNANQENPAPLHAMVLVNQNTGQRIRLRFDPIPQGPELREDDIIDGDYGFLARPLHTYRHTPYWKCHDSDYSWLAVMDDFGYLQELPDSVQNIRGY